LRHAYVQPQRWRKYDCWLSDQLRLSLACTQKMGATAPLTSKDAKDFRYQYGDGLYIGCTTSNYGVKT